MIFQGLMIVSEGSGSKPRKILNPFPEHDSNMKQAPFVVSE
jgi:hypothetical protein